MFIAISVMWLVVPIVGLVMALVTRQRNPQRSVYAMIGFGAIALDAAISLVFSISLMTSGVSDNPLHFLTDSVVVQIARQLVQLVGWALLIMALFWTDRYARSPQSIGTGPHQQGAPGQQYPGQYAGQQHPGQAHPGQQYPAQQYPGQQSPAQQYPAQQHYPGQPLPGQQPPTNPYPGSAPPQ
jgi:hypothetical protein